MRSPASPCGSPIPGGNVQHPRSARTVLGVGQPQMGGRSSRGYGRSTRSVSSRTAHTGTGDVGRMDVAHLSAPRMASNRRLEPSGGDEQLHSPIEHPANAAHGTVPRKTQPAQHREQALPRQSGVRRVGGAIEPYPASTAAGSSSTSPSCTAAQ